MTLFKTLIAAALVSMIAGNLCKRPVAELAGPMVAGCF